MQSESFPFTLPENIGELANESLLNKRDGIEQPPPWVGRFWNEEMVSYSTIRRSIRRPRPFGYCENPIQDACIVSRLHNVPTRTTIEDAAQFRPEARALLEEWRSIWERSFPDAFEDEVASGRENERPTAYYSRNQADRHLKQIERFAQGGSLKSYVLAWQTVDKVLALRMQDFRDYRLHIIDDAEAVTSFRHIQPGYGVLALHGKLYRLTGHGADGIPLFEMFEREKKTWEPRRLEDHPEYWFWPSFQKYMGRRSVYAESLTVAGALVADMAWQGESHAFIKAARPKDGTWTLNLQGIKTIEQGERALQALIGRAAGQPVYPVIVQEHVPFTHEQRLFVIDGKLVTSVCSDRNFAAVDARRNRRLDDRLAVLTKPSIDQGSFDRGVTTHVVDRKSAAHFARLARQIARELKEEGQLDYVIDLGLTERGAMAVEINTVHFAGPYCMERQWVMKAYNRRREKLEKALKVAVMSNTSKRTSDRQLLAVAENFLASPFIENALTREMKRQSEHGLEFVAETVSSQLLVKSIIAAGNKESRHGK